MNFTEIRDKFLKFASVGALMTLFTFGSITLFIKYLHTPVQLTYATVNVVAIFISFYLNSIFTFKNKISLANTLKYYGIYLTSTAMGTHLIGFFQSLVDLEKWIYPFLTLPFTLSFNFIMSSKYLTVGEDMIISSEEELPIEIKSFK